MIAYWIICQALMSNRDQCHISVYALAMHRQVGPRKKMICYNKFIPYCNCNREAQVKVKEKQDKHLSSKSLIQCHLLGPCSYVGNMDLFVVVFGLLYSFVVALVAI